MSFAESSWTASLVAVGIASALPLASTVALAQRPALVERWVPKLVFLAAGALLGAALFHLIPESLRVGSPGRVAALVLAGMAAFALLERAVHGRGAHHHHLHPTDAQRASNARSLVPLTIASDALHNVIDGVLIASAFLAGPSLGIVTGAAIALHELPRELGTFAICVRGGMTPRRAILVNVATGVLAIAGALAALILGARVSRLGEILMPFAAGTFLYLASSILWGERDALRAPYVMRAAGLVAIGVLLTAVLTKH